MASNTIFAILSLTLFISLISTSLARPELSDSEKEKLAAFLDPKSGKIRPGMLSNMRYDTIEEDEEDSISGPSDSEKAKLKIFSDSKSRKIRPGILPNMRNDKVEEYDEDSRSDKTTDIIKNTLLPEKMTDSIATFDVNDQNSDTVVKLSSCQKLSLKNIQKLTRERKRRHRKKSKVIINCFNCTINV